MREKKDFLTNYGLTPRFSNLEKKEPDLWPELEKIYERHEKRRTKLEGVIQSFVKDLGMIEAAHSIRYRIKASESLIVKIIEKKCDQHIQSKYEHINSENYYKIITDLIGVRILIRYRYQWEAIHKEVVKKFNLSPDNYITDWINQYKGRTDAPFIAEQPIVYFRKNEDPKIYFACGKNTFALKPSEIGYSSIHYIINYDGDYVELQVRTLFDEAWSECDHDFVYKAPTGPKKLVLKKSSHILSNVTNVADELSTFIHDYSENTLKDEVETAPETVSSIHQPFPERYKKVPVKAESVSDILDLF